MTNYTKTMREALESMYISEDNVGILRDIVKRKQAKPLKFADGKMKVDLFTASAVTQALDKVNPANKAKITKLINTGKKANFMSVAKVVMKSENDPEVEEENEGFASDAQRRAAFASGYKEKGKKKKEEADLDEAVKVGDNVKVKLSRKGREYIEKGKVTKIEKDSIIVKHDFSRTPSKVKMTDIVKEEADLDEAMLKGRDYEYDEKEGVVKISKKNFAKVKKDYKGTDKSKPTMMVLTKKGTSLVPVKFTEEVELDEGKNIMTSDQADALLTSKAKLLKRMPSLTHLEFTAKELQDLDKKHKDLFLKLIFGKTAMKKGKTFLVKPLRRLAYEEVEVQEKRAIKNYKYDKAFFVNDGKDKLKNILDREGYDEISLGDYLSQKAGLKNRDNLYFDGGSLVYGSKTIVKGAYGKTVSKLLDVVKNIKEEVEESYEVGTDEYAKHTREVTPGQEKEIDEARPSARRDAMRDMGKRGKDPADIDDYKATADDRKAASKNIIVQLRKAADLGGTHEVVFKDKKKVKVKPAIAMAFIKKFEKMKPADKAKLQDKGSKSYRDLLKGLKEEDTSMLGRIERKLKEIRNG